MRPYQPPLKGRTIKDARKKAKPDRGGAAKKTGKLLNKWKFQLR